MHCSHRATYALSEVKESDLQCFFSSLIQMFLALWNTSVRATLAVHLKNAALFVWGAVMFEETTSICVF